MADGQDRREFLKRGVVAVGGAAAGTGLGASAVAGTPRPVPQNPRTPAAMPTRNLGRTGYSVGIFSLGGQASVELPRSSRSSGRTAPSPRSSRRRSRASSATSASRATPTRRC